MNNYVKSITLLQQDLKQSTEQLNTIMEEKDKIYQKRDICEIHIGWIKTEICDLEKKKNILVNFKSLIWNKCKLNVALYLLSETLIGVFSFTCIDSWLPFFACCSLLNFSTCYIDIKKNLKEERYVKKNYKLSDIEKDLKKDEDELSLLNERKNDLDSKIEQLEKQQSKMSRVVENIDDILNEFLLSYNNAMNNVIHDSKISAYKKEISELGNRYSHEMDTILNHEYEEQGMGLKLVKEET